MANVELHLASVVASLDTIGFGPALDFIDATRFPNIASEWLRYKQAQPPLPATPSPSPPPGFLARFANAISARPRDLINRVRLSREAPLSGPATPQDVVEARSALEHFGHAVVEILQHLFQQSPGPRKDSARRLCDIFSEVLLFLIHLPRLWTCVGTPERPPYPAYFSLLATVFHVLCISAQTARAKSAWVLELLQSFQVNDALTSVLYILEPYEVLPSGLRSLSVASYLESPPATNATILQLSELESSEGCDFIGCLVSFIKSLSQMVDHGTVLSLIERQDLKDGTTVNCPLWKVQLSLFTHPDAMVRTHVQSSLLSFLQILPDETLEQLCFRTPLFASALDRVLRLLSMKIDRPLIRRRAVVCQCLDIPEPPEEPTPVNNPDRNIFQCRYCGEVGSKVQNAVDDFDDFISFLDEMLQSQPFKNITSRAIILSYILERFVLPVCVRSITAYPLPGDKTTASNGATQRTRFAIRSNTSHGIRFTRAPSSSRPKVDDTDDDTDGCRTPTGATRRRRRRSTVCVKRTSPQRAFASARRNPVTEMLGFRLDPVTTRICLERLRLKLTAHAPHLLTELALSAPAVPAFVLSHVYGMSFLHLMPKLANDRPNDGGCCCCRSATVWPSSTWFEGPAALPDSRELLKLILARLWTTTQHCADFCGHGAAMAHYGHLVRNPTHAARTEAWSRIRSPRIAEDIQRTLGNTSAEHQAIQSVRMQQAVVSARFFAYDLAELLKNMPSNGSSGTIRMHPKYLSIIKLKPSDWHAPLSASPRTNLIGGVSSSVTTPERPLSPHGELSMTDMPKSSSTLSAYIFEEPRTSAEFFSVEIRIALPEKTLSPSRLPLSFLNVAFSSSVPSITKETPVEDLADQKVVEVQGRHLHNATYERVETVMTQRRGMCVVRVAYPREDIDELEWFWSIWSSLFYIHTMSIVEIRALRILLKTLLEAPGGDVVDELKQRENMLMMYWRDELSFFAVEAAPLEQLAQSCGPGQKLPRLPFVFARSQPGQGSGCLPLTLMDAVQTLQSNLWLPYLETINESRNEARMETQKAMLCLITFIYEVRQAMAAAEVVNGLQRRIEGSLRRRLIYDRVVRRRWGESSKIALERILELLFLIDDCRDAGLYGSERLAAMMSAALSGSSALTPDTRIKLLHLVQRPGGKLPPKAPPESVDFSSKDDEREASALRDKLVVPCRVIQGDRVKINIHYLCIHADHLLMVAPDQELLGYGLVKHALPLDAILPVHRGALHLGIAYLTELAKPALDGVKFESLDYALAGWTLVVQGIAQKLCDRVEGMLRVLQANEG